MKLKFNFNKRNRYKNICSIEGCNIVVLKVVKDEEMRNNK